MGFNSGFKGLKILTLTYSLALFCKLGGGGVPRQVSAVENFLNVDTRDFVSERAGFGLDERA